MADLLQLLPEYVLLFVLQLGRAMLVEKLEHDHTYAADLFKAVVSTLAGKLRSVSNKFVALTQVNAIHPEAGDDVALIQEELDKFKVLLMQLDKEALETGSISTEGYQRLIDRTVALIRLRPPCSRRTGVAWEFPSTQFRQGVHGACP